MTQFQVSYSYLQGFLLILGVSAATQTFYEQFQYQLVCSLASL